MKIGLDISQTPYIGTGSARYTASAVDAIVKYDTHNDWIFFFSALRRKINKTLEKSILDKHYTLKKYPFPPSMLHYGWNRLHRIPIERLIGTLDWFITSDWTQPPAKCKIATLVHDLAFIRHPEVVAENIIQAQHKRLEWAKKESSLFLSLSYATQADLIDTFGIDEKRIKVLYPPVAVSKQSDETVKNIVHKFKLEKPFILAVGKIEPRKNLKKLIEAFNLLKQDEVSLLIVGPEGWEHIDRSLHKNVFFTGYVTDEELYSLYQSALFFVSPSIWEGFGYPLIEAMLLDCPTACSNVSSLKEIGEGASLQFNPHEVKEIKNALHTMIGDESVRKSLIKKGQERSKSFTQENYYNNLIKILQD